MVSWSDKPLARQPEYPVSAAATPNQLDERVVSLPRKYRELGTEIPKLTTCSSRPQSRWPKPSIDSPGSLARSGQ